MRCSPRSRCPTTSRARRPGSGCTRAARRRSARRRPRWLRRGRRAGTAVLPFAWTGWPLHAAGATPVRVRVAPAGPARCPLTLADPDGLPVATIGSVAVRPLSSGTLDAARTAGNRNKLFQLDWVDATAAGAAAPAAVAVAATPGPQPHDAVLGADGLGTAAANYPDLDAVSEIPAYLLWAPSGTGTGTGTTPAGRRRRRRRRQRRRRRRPGPPAPDDPRHPGPGAAVAGRRPVRRFPAGGGHPRRGGHRRGPGAGGRVGPGPRGAGRAPDRLVLLDLDADPASPAASDPRWPRANRSWPCGPVRSGCPG